EVALLAILDTPAHASAIRLARRRPGFWRRLLAASASELPACLLGCVGSGSDKPVGARYAVPLRARARLIKQWLLLLIERLGFSPPDGAVNLGTRHRLVPAGDWWDSPLLQAHRRALRDYVAGVSTGPLTLLSATASTSLWPGDPTYGWGTIVPGQVQVRRITGGHLEMLREPDVR